LATDVPAYFEAMQAGMDACPGIVFCAESLWRRETLSVKTKYERKWMGQGKPIYFSDWRKTDDGTPYPFEWHTAPNIKLAVLPNAGSYGNGRFTAKVFPPLRKTPHRAGFYLIDHQFGVGTPGHFDSQTKTVSIKGGWTPWKIELLAEIIRSKH